MSRVVCHVLVHAKRVTFRWTQEDRSFEPYVLEGESLREFWVAAAKIQSHLPTLANSTPDDQQQGFQQCFQLAELGYDLYRGIFPQSEPFRERVNEIRKWLQGLHDNDEMLTLEIVGDTPGRVPWNAVYQSEPDQVGFQTAASESMGLFWGTRYNLTSSHRVNFLRFDSLLVEPHTLLVVDPRLKNLLPESEQTRLVEFAKSQGAEMVSSRAALTDSIRVNAPDVLYFFCRTDGGGVFIDDAHVTLAELRKCLQSSDSCPEPWNNVIVVVNPVANHSEEWPALKKSLHAERFAGLIAPESPLNALPASTFAIDLLESFLTNGVSIGEQMHRLRTNSAPFGLVYGTYCPPQVRVSWEADDQSEEAEQFDRPLPSEPYRPLWPCDSDERALLAARDNDVNAVAEKADAPGVHLTLLHGRSGVGKASVLRSGVVPLLNEQAVGYHALRDRDTEEDSEFESDYPVLAIRATNDLTGQFALALCAFAARPWTYSTPTKRVVEVDLFDLLLEQVRGANNGAFSTTAITESTNQNVNAQGTSPEHDSEPADSPAMAAPGEDAIDPAELRDALLADATLAGRILASWSAHLPAELFVLVEQVEELFTLSRTRADVANRRGAMALLAAVAEVPGHSKVLMSARTEYAGRICVWLERHLLDEMCLVAHFLAALNIDELTQVIVQPTLDEAFPFSAEVPAERYGFRFEQGLPRQIAVDAVRAANDGNEESLPLVQVVCFLLYLRAESREDKTIAEADLVAIQGVSGCLHRYLKRALANIIPSADKRHLLPFLEQFYRVHPDGLLTRTIVGENDCLVAWRGVTPFAEVAEAATSADLQLLHENVTFNGKAENTGYSLGHEAVTPVLRELVDDHDRRKYGRGRILDTLFIVVPIMILLGVAGYIYFIMPRLADGSDEADAKKRAKTFSSVVNLLQREVRLRGYRYVGQMHQARAAWAAGDLVLMRRLLRQQTTQSPGVKFFERTRFGAGLRQDLRGFEWYYLMRLARPEQNQFTVHNSGIAALILAGDGTHLVSASHKGGIFKFTNILQAESTKELIRSPDKTVDAIALAPNGKDYALAHEGQNVVKLFTTSVGKRDLTGHTDAITALAFTADSSRLISASKDKTVRVWNVKKPVDPSQLKEHKAAVSALAVSPQGNYFATSDTDNQVIIWDLEKEQKHQIVRRQAGKVQALVFAPDGKTLVVAGLHQAAGLAGGFISFWNADSGKSQLKDITTTAPVRALAFLPDGKTLFSGGNDNIVTTWNVQSGATVGSFKSHDSWINTIAVARNGAVFASGSKDQTVRVWTLPKPRQVIRDHDDWLCSVAVAHNSRWAACGGRDGSVKVWDLTNGRLLASLKGHAGPVLSLTYTGDGDKELLITSDAGDGKKPGRLLLWTATNHKFHKELKGVQQGIFGLATSADGAQLAACENDGTVRIWDLEHAKMQSRLTGAKGRMNAVTFATKQQFVIGAGNDGFLYMWKVSAPAGEINVMKRIAGHKGPIHALAFDDEASQLYTGGDDRTILGWAVGQDSLKPLFTLPASSAIRGLSIRPTQATIASAENDGTVRLWHLYLGEQGIEPFDFREHSGPARSVVFSRDGNVLVSVGHDKSLRIRQALAPEK